MNRPPSIPFSIIRELRCRNCQNVVSCGPVYVVPDESILCGRCHHLAKNIYHNTSFEALASMFVYPCQYWEEHCSKILQWDECFTHEEECSYKSGCKMFWKHPAAFFKGKREIPYGDIRLIPIPEKLLDQIKCVHCESYLSCEPVFIQPDGKNICHRCIYSNGIPADSVRNTAYEILSNIIIFPCVFRNRGCPTRLKFGTDLWHHEAECSYNQMYKKPEKRHSQKERGVIQTHSGHYYGTITPHSAAFAPLSPTSEFDINKELVKSLKKQQGRKLIKAEELNSRMISDDGSRDASASSDADSEKANSYDKSLSSITSTPTRLDEPDSRRLTPNIPKDQSRHSNNIKQNNYYENTYLTQIHQEQNTPRHSKDNSYNKHSPPPKEEDLPINKISSGSTSPLYDENYNLMAGHYPNFTTPYGQGLIPKPSLKGVVRTDSLSSNRELIQELRMKQSKLKNKNTEMKEADPSPYKECNNLEEILQVHDKISN